MIKSERGLELFCYGVGDRPVLTVENYCKWYDMYIIFPDGHVESMQSDARRADLASDVELKINSQLRESAYCDHSFNPKYFILLAEALDIDYDTQALEAVAGRWANEVIHEFDNVSFKDKP